jgi:hypothetical protein
MKQVQGSAAHRQHLRPVLEMDIRSLVGGTHDARNGTKIDHDRAVNLRELRSIELRDEFLQRRADDRLAHGARFMPRNDGIFLLGAQKIDIRDRDQSYGLARGAAADCRSRTAASCCSSASVLTADTALRSRSCSLETVWARRAASTGFTK